MFYNMMSHTHIHTCTSPSSSCFPPFIRRKMSKLLSCCHAPLAPPRYPQLNAVRTMVNSTVKLSQSPDPIHSLRRGSWVKLICGASFEDVADVRNLSLVYALAGVDCIDCAADASVVNAVNEGIEVARLIAGVKRPWVMISVNDDKEDLHFRKAEFDPEECPADCSKPCELICPADAISLEKVPLEGQVAGMTGSSSKLQGGVKKERCYGCGRCFSVCPYDKIRAVTYVRDVATTSELLIRDDVDAIEIHTSARKHDLFEELWTNLRDSIQHVKLVAISLPDIGNLTTSAMYTMFSIMESNLHCYNLWQLDGRPMSGDIGVGATRDAIAFAVRLASAKNRPDGFLQLAGGTNSHTVDCLKREGLFQTFDSQSGNERCIPHEPGSLQALIGGVAYGGYARKIVGRVLQKMTSQYGHANIEDYPDYLLLALREALGLVGPMKCNDECP